MGGVILNLLDDVSSWEPGDRIVVASTDYSMYQTEEFTLLPCPECTKHQVKVKGMRAVTSEDPCEIGICSGSSKEQPFLQSLYGLLAHTGV